MNDLQEHIAIIGLGLMGGSLAKSLKRLAHPPQISAHTAEAYAAGRAAAEGAIDFAARTIDEAVAEASMVVFATPVDATLSLLSAHASLLKATNAVVTDVGSVKLPVEEAARALGLRSFVGGHPLCGSEQSGYHAARADLYDGGTVYVVRGDDAAAHRRVASLWEAARAHVAEVDAATHDRRMAWVSHVPQILASALADTLADRGISAAALGPGGAGMVRLAASAPAMWTEILRHNRDEVVPALRALGMRIAAFEAAVSDGDDQRLQGLLERARLWREGGRR